MDIKSAHYYNNFQLLFTLLNIFQSSVYFKNDIENHLLPTVKLFSINLINTEHQTIFYLLTPIIIMP